MIVDGRSISFAMIGRHSRNRKSNDLDLEPQRVLALVLEGTLISYGVSQIARLGLQDFLVRYYSCPFPLIVVFTAIGRRYFRNIFPAVGRGARCADMDFERRTHSPDRNHERSPIYLGPILPK